MDPEGRRAFGARVANLRIQRGLTQKALASSVGRTTSWLSQVERGVQPVNRLDVLRLLADALGVPVNELRPDAPQPESAEPAPEPNDLDQARLLISGHAALGALLAAEEPEERPSLADLLVRVDLAWSLAHDGRLSQLSAEMNTLVPQLERATRTVAERERAQAFSLLARAYQALSAAFTRQNEADAAWVAADRSIAAAERSGRPLEVFAGTFRLAHAFVRLRRYDQADHTARTAASALARHLSRTGETPESLSVLGSLHLALAVVHARCGSRTEARQEIATARRLAARLGGDRNDLHLEFGPTNVEVQAVAIAVDLGDAGEALEAGESLNASGLSTERQARLALDLGRAHAQLRHSGEALSYFLRAEHLAPEMMRSHTSARSAIRDLVLVAGRSASAELKELARRADAMP
ncbi:helix-turn-helix domain-containing protein [Streptomyces hiroshimensis]|uniref:Transcriptional regulator n=1 Tax=Streptomyces hiroshimensis TaxID=66424 RepID=A0ABQ2Y810_9ACTN|nr:helix-turn-helix transcriptional regulator [Streptomyces hiroshimensis]GGX71952.1 transcriptional regulator [Streptomyces hiroshimensis]